MITTAPPTPSAAGAEAPAMPQWRPRRIAAVWAAAAVPMGVLGWLVAPWLAHRIGGRDPFITSLLVCFNAGLLWQLGLVLGLVRRERGSLSWTNVREALWLRAPRDPKSGRRGGRVWLWAFPFVLLSAAINALPIDPTGPLPRDFPNAIESTRVEHYFHGNWAGFALLVLVAFLAPVVEELVFRGLLLPRMRAVFGRRDIWASGAMFALYHVHQPWSMPASLIDGALGQAYPTRRFRSTWMGVITHTAPSVLIFGVVLSLVL